VTRRIGPIVAPRFVSFGVVSAAWLATIVFRAWSPLRAAGLAWFATWGIQIAVSLVSWMHPLSLPSRYYRPASAAGRSRLSRLSQLSRLAGVKRFGRVARWIHPLHFDRGCPQALDARMAAAETTHVITLVAVGMLAVASLARGYPAMALFLAVWNVLFNLYPVVLQRHNRARLWRFRQRRIRSV
jgi:hypothetical protein